MRRTAARSSPLLLVGALTVYASETAVAWPEVFIDPDSTGSLSR